MDEEKRSQHCAKFNKGGRGGYYSDFCRCIWDKSIVCLNIIMTFDICKSLSKSNHKLKPITPSQHICLLCVHRIPLWTAGTEKIVHSYSPETTIIVPSRRALHHISFQNSFEHNAALKRGGGIVFQRLLSLIVACKGPSLTSHRFSWMLPIMRKFQSKLKWNASVQVEIFREKWSISRGGPLWPVGPVWPKPAVPFSKILVSNRTSLGSHQNFGRNVNGTLVSFEQCRSIFPWLVPLVSDWTVWHNGKHPFFLQKPSLQKVHRSCLIRRHLKHTTEWFSNWTWSPLTQKGLNR